MNTEKRRRRKDYKGEIRQLWGNINQYFKELLVHAWEMRHADNSQHITAQYTKEQAKRSEVFDPYCETDDPIIHQSQGLWLGCSPKLTPTGIQSAISSDCKV